MRRKRVIFLLSILLLCGIGLHAQNVKYQWHTTAMDTTWNPCCAGCSAATSAIIAKYKPGVDEFSAPVGTCPKGLVRGYPEAPLSDWATDILRDYAQNYLDTTGRGDERVDFALMNFGGIRADFPAGSISKEDIITTFPFNNYLVIVSLPGDKVKMLMEFFAKTNKLQPMSDNVKIRVSNGAVSECIINGKPVDDAKTYNIATMDFLLNGGDGMYPLQYNTGVIETSIKMMDLIIKTVEDLTARGGVIEKEMDGRSSVTE